MTNVRLTLLNGNSVDIDAELVDPSTDVQPMADPLGAGVSRGTRVTPSSGSPIDVAESVQIVKTIILAALAPQNLSSFVLRASMTGGQQDTTTTVLAAIPGLSITVPVGGAGTYLGIISGVAMVDAQATTGGKVTIAKGGAPIGKTLEWGVGQFAVTGLAAMGVGAMGFQYGDALVDGDVLTVQFARIGAAGTFSVLDVTLTLIKID